MNVIKDIDNESWGWFIDLESNQPKEIVKKNLENYNYLLQKFNSFNKCIIIFNIIGSTIIIYLMFYLFIPVRI